MLHSYQEWFSKVTRKTEKTYMQIVLHTTIQIHNGTKNTEVLKKLS